MRKPLSYFQRMSLRYQVALGVAVGFLILFGMLGYLANTTIQRSTEAAKLERLKLAETTAASIDAVVARALYQLQVATDVVERGGLSEEAYLTALGAELEHVYHIIGSFNDLVLVNATRDVFWSYPRLSQTGEEAIGRLPSIWQALLTGLPVIIQTSEVVGEYPHPPVAVVALPLPSPATNHLLVGTLHLSHMGVQLVHLPKGSPTFVAQIINDEGAILASSAGSVHAVVIDPHVELLEPLVRSHQSGVRLHEESGGGHLVAYAPLTILNGGVVVEEQRDLALAVPRQLQRTMFTFGFLALLVVSLGAWWHARYVTQPLVTLQRATQRIAAGSLEHSVTLERGDEVGMLAKDFEAMRLQLKAASEQRGRFEAELENRVRERTQEVHLLLGKIITAQEEERKRLARELHDETAQALAALLVSIQALQSSLPPEQARVKELLQRALAQGERALTDVRRMILDLRPSALDDLGFVPALHSYALERLTPAGIKVTFETAGAEQRFPGPVETALFRILQEAVNNIARHSRAQRVNLRLEFKDSHFTALVEDDGVGFDPLKLAGGSAEGGLGLQGMKERAELVGARLEIVSQPGSGTRIKVELAQKEEGLG